MSDQTKTSDSKDDRLTSEELGALIIDALLSAGLLRETDISRAMAIATEEIEVRKALGDY